MLPDVARDLDVSIATAGQLRTVSGLAAGLTALATGLLAARVGPPRAPRSAGSRSSRAARVLSAAAPGFAVLVVAQALGRRRDRALVLGRARGGGRVGAPGERSRVLAHRAARAAARVDRRDAGRRRSSARSSWRLAWVVVPVAMARSSPSLLVLRRPSTPPARAAPASRAVLAYPGVARWSRGELLAFSGWAGALVFMGALFVESYGLSIAATGLALGLGALVYVPGNLLFRRWVDDHGRRLLVGLALAAAVRSRCSAPFARRRGSASRCSPLLCVHRRRAHAGGKRARRSIWRPSCGSGVTGVRTAALQRGYFVGAAVGGAALASAATRRSGWRSRRSSSAPPLPHLLPARRSSPQPHLP